jgi:hypothetical protein
MKMIYKSYISLLLGGYSLILSFISFLYTIEGGIDFIVPLIFALISVFFFTYHYKKKIYSTLNHAVKNAANISLYSQLFLFPIYLTIGEFIPVTSIYLSNYEITSAKIISHELYHSTDGADNDYTDYLTGFEFKTDDNKNYECRSTRYYVDDISDLQNKIVYYKVSNPNTCVLRDEDEGLFDIHYIVLFSLFIVTTILINVYFFRYLKTNIGKIYNVNAKELKSEEV